MSDLRSPSGRPLASAEWLVTHHRAKQAERLEFARSLGALAPRRVVDLGCGTGLWLELLDQVVPPNCELIGVDSDPAALELALSRSSSWHHRAAFQQLDIEADPSAVPDGDLTLLFSVCPYLTDPAALLTELRSRAPSTVAIRQYDGDAFRFGPMATAARAVIDASLRSATLGSSQFRHYDMDRAFALTQSHGFADTRVAFEVYQRFAPFDADFLAYARETIQWMRRLVSEEAIAHLDGWVRRLDESTPAYWFEVEMAAVLS